NRVHQLAGGPETVVEVSIPGGRGILLSRDSGADSRSIPHCSLRDEIASSRSLEPDSRGEPRGSGTGGDLVSDAHSKTTARGRVVSTTHLVCAVDGVVYRVPVHSPGRGNAGESRAGRPERK